MYVCNYFLMKTDNKRVVSQLCCLEGLKIIAAYRESAALGYGLVSLHAKSRPVSHSPEAVLAENKRGHVTAVDVTNLATGPYFSNVFRVLPRHIRVSRRSHANSQRGIHRRLRTEFS